jgi:hypothetical protein
MNVHWRAHSRTREPPCAHAFPTLRDCRTLGSGGRKKEALASTSRISRFGQPRARRRIAVVAVVSALLGALTLGAIGFAGREDVRPVPAPSPADLAALAEYSLAFSTRNGEPNPANAELVPTSERAAILATSGAEVSSDRDVYFVTLHGQFTGHSASRHPRRRLPPPRGKVLAIAFDSQTLGLVFWGITNRAPVLANHGQPIPLSLTTSSR